MIDQLKPLMGKLTHFAQQEMGFAHPPRLFLKNDKHNADMPLGKTAFYDPDQESVTLFVTGRHPKDILRSLAHELVHHVQNLRGDLHPEKVGAMGDNYAQDNDHMRNMEKEAYLQGNMCFRDWEDGLNDEDKQKYKLAESKFLKENKKVTTKLTTKSLEQTIRKVLSEQTPPYAREEVALMQAMQLAKAGGLPKERAQILVDDIYRAPEAEKEPSLADLWNDEGDEDDGERTADTLQLYKTADSDETRAVTNTRRESKFSKDDKQMNTKNTENLLKETIEKILKEQLTRGRDKYDMSHLGSGAIGGMDALNSMDSGEEEVDKVDQSKLDQTILPFLKGFWTDKRYGVMPNLSDVDSFKEAHAMAREAGVPFYY